MSVHRQFIVTFVNNYCNVSRTTKTKLTAQCNQEQKKANLDNKIVNPQKRKYNNTKVYFDPVKGVAYRKGLFRTREFRLLKDLNSSILKRCYQFDSMHEYYCYRIVALNLPISLQLLRQVSFLVVPKSNLGSAVTYRADLVVAPIEIDEKGSVSLLR